MVCRLTWGAGNRRPARAEWVREIHAVDADCRVGEAGRGGNFMGRAPPRERAHYERGFGLMFQDYMLFPHMTVGQNVALGCKFLPAPPAPSPRGRLTLKPSSRGRGVG